MGEDMCAGSPQVVWGPLGTEGKVQHQTWVLSLGLGREGSSCPVWDHVPQMRQTDEYFCWCSQREFLQSPASLCHIQLHQTSLFPCTLWVPRFLWVLVHNQKLWGMHPQDEDVWAPNNIPRFQRTIQ